MQKLEARLKAIKTKTATENNVVVVYSTWGEGKPVERTCEGVTTMISWEEWLDIKNDDAIDVVSLI